MSEERGDLSPARQTGQSESQAGCQHTTSLHTTHHWSDSMIWWYHESPRQPSTTFHVTTVAVQCHRCGKATQLGNWTRDLLLSRQLLYSDHWAAELGQSVKLSNQGWEWRDCRLHSVIYNCCRLWLYWDSDPQELGSHCGSLFKYQKSCQSW